MMNDYKMTYNTLDDIFNLESGKIAGIDYKKEDDGIMSRDECL